MTSAHSTHIRPRGVTARLARWSIRHPGWAVGLWLSFVAAAVVAGGMTETRQATSADLGVGESGRAERLIESADFADPPTDLVLITPRDITPRDPARRTAAWDPAAATAAAEQVSQRLEALPEVADVAAPVASPATDALLLRLTLTTGATGEPDIAPVLAELAALAPEYPDLRIEGVGGRSIGHQVNQTIDADLTAAGLLSVPVTLAILLVVFGALLAAGVPLLLAFSAVAAASGLWVFASQLIPDIGTVPHVILLIGLAVGVDYSLFYLKRTRQERARGRGTVDAVQLAAATSGRAVVVSALTSVVALAGLYLSGDAIFAALGTGVILAVAVSMLGSVTVLPAVLVKLGRAVDRPRVPLLWRLTNAAGQSRVWPALLAPVLRAPRTTVAVAFAALALLALPALGMNLRSSTEQDLPRDIPVMRGYDRLVAAFPTTGAPHRVVVRAPADQAGAVRAALADLAARASARPEFTLDEEPQVRTSPDRTVSTIDIPYPDPIGSPAAQRSLSLLRTDLVPATVGTVPGAEYAVGGITAENVDYTDQQVARLPWVIGFVVSLTVGMMAWAFRSIVVALVAGVLTVLSVAAAFGLLTLVFQGTWAEALLDFESTGHIVNWVPLFLFVVLFGLSMDYHVFVVSRIREAAATGMTTRDAVRVGLTRAAGVIISAAAVMVAVFAVFATLSLIEMKQLGVGLAAAVAIDATVVRIVLLPAVMSLLGRANWWPSRLGRSGARPAPPARTPSPPARTPVAGRG